MKSEDLTAWALGEIAEEDLAGVEAELREDPVLQEAGTSTKAFCSFLNHELMDEALALRPAQRAAILAARTSAPPKAEPNFKPRPLRWYQRPAIPMAAAAAVIILGALASLYLSPHGAKQDEVMISRVESIKITGGRRKAADSPGLAGITPATGGGSLMKESSSGLTGELEIKAAAPRLPLDRTASVQAGEMSSLVAATPPPPVVKLAGNHASITLPGTSAPVPALRLQQAEGGFGNRRMHEAGNTENDARVVDNALVSVSREPLSTFSLDVDTASYANVRRFLNQGARPPRDAVRIEELINYFPTAEPGPEAGSKQPFQVKVEMASCPWQPQHRLARIHLKAREIPAGSRPSNLVFLVDVSGSMESEDKLPLVQRSLRMLVERLGESDRVSMVTYAGGTEVVLPSTHGAKKAEILAAVDRLQAGGGTHGSAGIRLAYEQAASGLIPGGVNRVILCTDGDFNVGVSDPVELAGLVAEKARSGVFLSVLGFGTDNLKDHTLETLADEGNGIYAYIDSVSEARKILVEQMQGTLVTVAKDVKVQVEFNPAAVQSYRLIGYENRLLAKEDFNDDAKDAGEVGAGHSMVALYELKPAGLPAGGEFRPAVDKLKYQPEEIRLAAPLPASSPAAAVLEALTVKVRYKEPEGTTSKLIEVALKDEARPLGRAGTEFKFTAAVAGFGLLLRESPHAGELNWDLVRRLAREGKGADPLGYRGEFLQLIEKAAAR